MPEFIEVTWVSSISGGVEKKPMLVRKSAIQSVTPMSMGEGCEITLSGGGVFFAVVERWDQLRDLLLPPSGGGR